VLWLARGFAKKKPAAIIAFGGFTIKGRRPISSQRSLRGSGYKDYGDELLNKVKLQLRLDTVGQLRDFVDCPMTEQDYITYLKSKGII
jgi:hypothetical protein